MVKLSLSQDLEPCRTFLPTYYSPFHWVRPCFQKSREATPPAPQNISPAVLLFRARPHIQSAKLWNLAFDKGSLEDTAFLTLPALTSPLNPLLYLVPQPSSPKAGALETQPVPLGQRLSNMMVHKNY